MALIIPKTWVDREHLDAEALNKNFNAVKGKFGRGGTGISNTDIAAGAAIAGSKLDLTANTGQITQDSTLSSNSTPSLEVVNASDGGAIEITGGGGPDLLSNGSLTIDLDNDNNGTSEKFSVLRDGATASVVEFEGPPQSLFSSLKTNSISINPAMFMPHSRLGTGNTIIATDGVKVLRANGSLGGTILAPIKLPHEARLTNLNVYYTSDYNTNGKLLVLRHTLASNSVAVVASIALAQTATITVAQFSFTDSEFIIDNSAESYTLKVFDIDNPAGSSDGDSIFGASITYKHNFKIPDLIA